MKLKQLFGIIIGVILFGVILFLVETQTPRWEVCLGLIIAWSLSLGMINVRNSFVVLSMTLLLLVSLYFSVKFNLVGMLPGGVAGASIGLLTGV